MRRDPRHSGAFEVLPHLLESRNDPSLADAHDGSGVLTESLVRFGDDQDLAEKANRTAAELRAALRQVLVEESVPWGIYGQSSTFLIYPNPTGEDVDPATFDPLKLGFAKLKGARSGPLTGKIRMGLMSHGVDVMGAPGGFVSATHGGAEIEKTVHALRQTVRALKAEGVRQHPEMQ